MTTMADWPTTLMCLTHNLPAAGDAHCAYLETAPRPRQADPCRMVLAYLIPTDKVRREWRHGKRCPGYYRDDALTNADDCLSRFRCGWVLIVEDADDRG